MLIDGSRIIGQDVLSLHYGGPIARIKSDIVDPNDLKVIAYNLENINTEDDAGNILETSDIRESSNLGLVVNSEDVFVSYGDVISLDKIIDLNFSLIGLSVITKKKSKLGKVIGYILDNETFIIEKLIIKRPTIKSLLDPELVIDRSEIIEIDDYKITIKDEEKTIKKSAETAEFTPNFVNPFRQEPSFSPSDNQTPDELNIE